MENERRDTHFLYPPTIETSTVIHPPEVRLTSSANANAAIALFETLSITDETTLAIEAQKQIGNANLQTLDRWDAMLSEADTVPAEFNRTTRPGMLRRFIAMEKNARGAKNQVWSERAWDIAKMVIASALTLSGASLLGILGGK